MGCQKTYVKCWHGPITTEPPLGITNKQWFACQKWADALKSGHYRQGRYILVEVPGPEEGDPLYCCLGVACHLVKNDLSAVELADYLSKAPNDPEHSIYRSLNLATTDWPQEVGKQYGMPRDVRQLLGEANDCGIPFSTISLMIREWASVARKEGKKNGKE